MDAGLIAAAAMGAAMVIGLGGFAMLSWRSRAKRTQRLRGAFEPWCARWGLRFRPSGSFEDGLYRAEGTIGSAEVTVLWNMRGGMPNRPHTRVTAGGVSIPPGFHAVATCRASDATTFESAFEVGTNQPEQLATILGEPARQQLLALARARDGVMFRCPSGPNPQSLARVGADVVFNGLEQDPAVVELALRAVLACTVRASG